MSAASLLRCAQSHRNVVGDLVAGHRDHTRVADGATREQREIGRAATDVDQADANLHSSRVRHAAADASGCNTSSCTLRPQRRTHFLDVLGRETAPVTMWTFFRRRRPLMPSGRRTPS